MLSAYNHIQSSSSASWTISHNFGTDSVVCDVYIDYDGSLEKALPDTFIPSSNSLTVTFTSAKTGRARVMSSVDAPVNP